MMLAAFGAAGLGCVWGWLVGMRDIRRVLIAAITLVAATFLLAIQVWIMAAPIIAALFVASSALAALGHAVWRAHLRRVYGTLT